MKERINFALVTVAAALALFAFAARAQTPSVAQATAPGDSVGTLSIDSPLGEIFDTPAALAALQKYVPEMAGDPATKKNLRTLNLRTISGYLRSVTPQKLSELDVELRQIPAPQPDMNGPAGDPVHKMQRLQITAIPKRAGKIVRLFNGRDLNDWDVFLGPAKRINGSYPAVGKPVGLNNDITGIFSVRTVDGGPVLRADGKIWGALTTKGEYSNYHFHAEYKWGEKRWPEVKPPKRNNGILYHSYGDYGVSDQTWMNSIELEIIPGQVAGANPVGFDSRFKTTVGRDLKVDTPTKRIFMVGGRAITNGVDGVELVQGASDAERPVGQWNSIDIYAFGDRAIHVLNGVPMIEIYDITGGSGHGPLTRGRIQLQSEGAETYFRNLSLRPINRLPIITVKP